jgi:hypothetical protein
VHDLDPPYRPFEKARIQGRSWGTYPGTPGGGRAQTRERALLEGDECLILKALVRNQAGQGAHSGDGSSISEISEAKSHFSQPRLGWAERNVMARQTLPEKTTRCLRFLLGLRHRAVQKALAARGLSDAVIEQGWDLLKAVGTARARFDLPAEVQSARPNPHRDLAELQDTWFPVARATLRARFPEVAAMFFSQLTRQRGGLVPTNMATFLARLGDLAAGAAPFGKEGPLARELLLKRGLTPEVEARAEAALALWSGMDDGPFESPEAVVAEEAALAALWTFYLEWSAIASRTLTNPAHLRWLGLSESDRRPRQRIARAAVQPNAVAGEPAPETTCLLSSFPEASIRARNARALSARPFGQQKAPKSRKTFPRDSADL